MNPGGDRSLKRPTFAVVNDMNSIASQIPQDPNPDKVMYLQREGADPSKRPKFRPFIVNRAVEYLMTHNFEYYSRAFGLRVPTPHLDEANEEKVVLATELIIPISEADENALAAASSASEAMTTSHSAEGDMVLLHTEAPLISKDELVLQTLGGNPHVLSMRKLAGYTKPDDSDTGGRFYELAFPCEYPYGHGGPYGKITGDHKLKPNDMLLLQIMRGGDRRFSLNKKHLFTAYSYHMRKNAGTVAYIADAFSNPASGSRSSSLDDDSAAADSSLPPLLASRPNDYIASLKGCPGSEEIIQTLTRGKGEMLSKLLMRLQPFAANLPGTPLHIALERRGLFAMMGSPDVSKDGEMRVFATNAPCDR